MIFYGDFQLTKVRVGHSNLGSYPDWFLKEMLIEVPSRDETYFFQYNNWVAGEEVDLDPGMGLISS